MKAIEFFKFLIDPNSGYSSKRFAALVLLMFGILIPIVCIFLNPIGEIHDSILLLALQLLASGCGLLGFTLKERPTIGKPRVIMPEANKNDENSKKDDIDDESDIGPDMNESTEDYSGNVKRRRGINYNDSNLG